MQKIFFFLDQTDAEGKDGEGECGTGSGRGQHHRPAGKHTHPRPVWPAGENVGPRSAGETGQLTWHAKTALYVSMWRDCLEKCLERQNDCMHAGN